MEELTIEAARTWCVLPSSFILWDDHPFYNELVVTKTWALSVFGTHRDADSVVRSNWTTLLKMLEAKPEWADSWCVSHVSCSLVGWRDHLSIQVFTTKTEEVWENDQWVTKEVEALTPIARFIHEISQKLDGYPVLDDDHLSELEYNETYDYWWAELKDDGAERYGWPEGKPFTEDDMADLLDRAPCGLRDISADGVRRLLQAGATAAST